MTNRNPFYLKDALVWRRENPLLSLNGSRFAIVGAMLAPVLLVLLLSSFNLVGSVAEPAWALSAMTWLAVVSMLAISSGLQVYTRERDLGALEIAAITPTTPWREVSGRFNGAFLPIVEAWLLGGAYVAASPFVGTEGHGNVAAALWVFSLLWFYALTAFALFWSARSRTTNEALTAFVSTVLCLNATYLLVSVLVEVPTTVLRQLPLNPMAFLQVGEWACGIHGTSYHGRTIYDHDMFRVWYALLLIYLPLWTAFRYAMLAATARAVGQGIPLKLGRAPQGPSGIVPQAVTLATPQAARPTPPLDHGLTDRLLRPFDGNPFYHAYRKGFMRVYNGVTAAPGSVMAAALSVVGLLLYRVFGFDENLSGGILIVAVLIASFIGGCEGLVIGARALSAERDQDTWPMLVVSGIRPKTLLRGKFASAFYALSGEWAVAAPFWLLAAIGSHPLIVLLALVQPATIALGILLGLWMASQPRYLVISLDKAAGAVIILLGGLWLLKAYALGSASIIGFLPMMNPVAMALNLAARDTVEGVLQLGLQASLALAAGAILWLHASRRLDKVLRGE